MTAFMALVCVPAQLFHNSTAYIGEYAPGGMFLHAVIVAPVVEELAYRGVAFGKSRRALGFWPSVIVNEVLFQMGHADIEYLAATVPVTIASAAMYEATGNIAYSILLHIEFNAMARVMAYVGIPAAIAKPLFAASMIGLVAVCTGAVRRNAEAVAEAA